MCVAGLILLGLLWLITNGKPAKSKITIKPNQQITLAGLSGKSFNMKIENASSTEVKAVTQSNTGESNLSHSIAATEEKNVPLSETEQVLFQNHGDTAATINLEIRPRGIEISLEAGNISEN